MNLGKRALRVTVVEARDRVGGRVWTDGSFGTSVPAELGAEFIHGRAPQTNALLRKAGVASTPTGGVSFVCNAEGRLQPRDDVRFASDIFEGARTLPDDVSVERYLRLFENDDAFGATARDARAFVEGFDAADPADASARAIADEWRSGVDSAAARPEGTYQPLVDYFGTACADAGVELRLSTVVRRITWRPSSVDIDVTGADGNARTIRARAAVVTLPVGVLRDDGEQTRVVFDPDLGDAKRAALNGIAMGPVVKLNLGFSSAFWERANGGKFRDAAFFRCEGAPFPTYWTQFPVRANLLVAWAGGPKARALETYSQAELVERALRPLEVMFGKQARTEFFGATMHDWNNDPFSRGAYSYVLVGGGRARAALAAPLEDVLFFAGEATSSDFEGGTVNGAIETGFRAAQEAAAALGALV